jgi:8-oxo-dGTP diphosphatase
MAPSIQPINTTIRFFSPENDDLVIYNFAIIVSRYKGQWLWVKHKERNTWELPAGHIEHGENALKAACRELYEETGALEYSIEAVISYEGELDGKQVFGKIFLAFVERIGPLPDFEIHETSLFHGLPEHLTYPQIQPLFFNYILTKMDEVGFNALTTLPNIGITLAEELVEAGIKNPEELFELGAENSFQLIQSCQKNACLSQLYALEGAIQGKRWHAIDSVRKDELRHFYNQLNPSSL